MRLVKNHFSWTASGGILPDGVTSGSMQNPDSYREGKINSLRPAFAGAATRRQVKHYFVCSLAQRRSLKAALDIVLAMPRFFKMLESS